jgi:hypothetical protein
MVDNVEVENGLSDKIAPKKVSHIEPTATKTFKAWHKPRKQWMRCNQWIKEIEALIPHLCLDGRPLRYLSLPGEDMLDIRVLADFCQKKGLSLKCLGFDEDLRTRSSEIEVNISRNEISNNIVPTSVIRADNLSVLKDTTSIGFKYVCELGPFDIINLDLCGAISCVNNPDNHQVLFNLCDNQINKSREKWLLFLTTRAEYEKVNIAHLPHYLKCLKNNAEKNLSFASRLVDISKWDISLYKDNINIANLLNGCRNSEFVRLFAVGFGKWLLQLLDNTHDRWIVEMLNGCWYRVEDNQTPESFPNMLSLAFLFSPLKIPIQDSTGLAQQNPPQSVDELSMALHIIEQTENFTDVDLVMDTNPDIWQRFVDESIALLKTARYSTDQYPAWAEEKKIRFK